VILDNLFDVSNFKRILAEKPEIVVTTHVNPDGDAIGSMLGLYLYLKKLGLKVSPISPNEYPEFLQWMPGNKDVIDFCQNKKFAERIIANAGIIFQVDYNDEKRAGDMKVALANSQAFKVMIDHHPNPQLKNDIMISVTQSSSTAELIFEFIQLISGIEFLDKDIAECLYTGILTDTGCFNYNSSRPRTFEIASLLLQNNIRKDEIFRQIYDNFSEQRMRLLGYCLNDKMKVFPEFNTAFISISLEEQDRFKFSNGDSEGFVNYPLSIKGINFTALFTERKDKVKISFRSKGKFPANIFAEKHFGGGGHLNAAGGESSLSLADTIQKFADLLPSFSNLLKE
jgi:phosphoesterase RecJ-like protein